MTFRIEFKYFLFTLVIMRLILVRHGESEENVGDTCSGQKDSPLTKNGRRQASIIAKHFTNIHIDAIYSSTMVRAYDTACAIAAPHQLPVVKDARIAEANFGNGAKSKSGLFGVIALVEIAQETGVDPFMYDAHGGESIGALAQRVEPFFTELLPKYHGKTVMVVCHGGVIRVTLLNLLKLSCEDIKSLGHKNTAYSILDVQEDGSWRAHVIAEKKHLES
jgi:broad specificity phosphatase PhoE